MGIDDSVEYAVFRSKIEVVDGVMNERGTVGKVGLSGLSVMVMVDDVEVEGASSEAEVVVLRVGRAGWGGEGSLGRMKAG